MLPSNTQIPAHVSTGKETKTKKIHNNFVYNHDKCQSQKMSTGIADMASDIFSICQQSSTIIHD